MHVEQVVMRVKHEVLSLVSPFCRFWVSKNDTAYHYMRRRSMICLMCGISLNQYILKTWLPNKIIRANKYAVVSDLFTFYLHKFNGNKEKTHVRNRTMSRSRARWGLQLFSVLWAQGLWCRGNSWWSRRFQVSKLQWFYCRSRDDLDDPIMVNWWFVGCLLVHQ